MYEEIDKFIDRIISNSTPARPLWNVEQSNGGNSKWNYIDGCMLTALLRLSSIESNKVFEDFVINLLDYYVSSDGSIVGYDKESYNLDNINEGRVLFDVYKVTEDKKYDRAIELLHSQLLSQPRTQTGNFWHKKIYPNQIWLDGLYMAQVFATRYAFQHDKDYSDIVNQFKNVRKLMYNADKGLYYHCCDCSKSAFWANEKGLSANFWLRANGWYLIALVDCIEYCDDVSTKHILSEILVEALSGILQYKDNATNMFYQVIDCAGREGNYLETSGSCMISYALLTAARLG
ncbi:MAG: glycoside hydrolase family 88 protein, partial [Clostridia bacterium]